MNGNQVIAPLVDYFEQIGTFDLVLFFELKLVHLHVLHFKVVWKDDPSIFKMLLQLDNSMIQIALLKSGQPGAKTEI